MSLDGFSKVFFGPRAPSTPIEVQPSFLKPGKESSPKADAFHKPSYGLKQLHHGKWQPKPLARPSFFVDKAATAGVGKKPGEYEAAKGRVTKAEAELAQAKAEYEKFENTAKAFKSMGKVKEAKLFSAKASVAKKKYEQKALAAKGAQQQMEKSGAKLAKPSLPAKGLAPAGEELSGPTGATLAKNHAALSATRKGAA
ncbi:hypothetical protein FBR05_04230 [Deltaproteobacteria bacterium PRO3]|nr:hypothetical protein [Deltaproteobacteria bacterium PRO3]